ncbi:hypothetical protein Hamer_G020027 [Homarus americanus]|uniref:DUF4789 domain-containing protein n=1 Tax=Homarus americanus TaxID=6706 RepID=A0A8J5T841_HOMAM|nr:hypothetical protein Hamer_G020027 [Homarus americanus]
MGKSVMSGPPPLIQAAVAASVGVGGALPPTYLMPPTHESLLHYSFPSEADTLAYVDALKHSDLSDWRSLQEVAARAGAGSCSGAVTTSVLTALYLLGLFNLCVASPASCCVPPAAVRTRRRRTVDPTLPPLLNNLQYNLSSLSLEQFRALPHVTTPDGGRVPLHISVVEQVRKLWDSNPRLLSSVSCSSATESVRSSFISLSGVASGIILAYSVAQLSQCYPDHTPHPSLPPKIWFFPIPKNSSPQPHFPVPITPREIPVPGKDEAEDGCERDEVPLAQDRCALLLSSEPCPYKHWVLLNKDTRMGECVPRLCADNFVYVEADQMCHDVNEPGICPGNRRLYLTAAGNAVCDCPEGMFPGPSDTCYFLYEPGYCQQGSVVMFDKYTKTLTCKVDPCGHVNNDLWPDDLPYAPRKDGYCYQFNEQGPCRRGQRFGYDTDQLEATCVSLREAGLVRPRRSFMFQQMSFPAAQDHRYNHYQVSYIIMNGTTWDLEVKGIRRSRREARSTPGQGPHFLHSGQMVVPFLDTREIPHDLYSLKRPRRPRWMNHRRTRRGNNHASRVRHRLNVRHQRSHGGTARGSHGRTPATSQPTSRKIVRETDDDDDEGEEPRAMVNQTSTAAPVVVQQVPQSQTDDTPPASRSQHKGRVNIRQSPGTKGQKRKRKGRRRRKKKGREGHNKKKKGRRRGDGRGGGRGGKRKRGRRKKKKPGTWKNSTQGERKRKNPKLPFRVPTVLSPADGNASIDGTAGVTGRDHSEGTGGSDKEQTTPDVFSEDDDLDPDEESEQSSSSEMSLPKYLRHRGRRQLGEGGGIIQAPLLSACKPGAKRDYNYKCRPKFIPQERDRRGAGGAGSLANTNPRPPRISCPEGTRLDPRGRLTLVAVVAEDDLSWSSGAGGRPGRRESGGRLALVVVWSWRTTNPGRRVVVEDD